MVSEGVHLEKGVVRDSAEWDVFPAEFLLQLQSLLKTRLFTRSLGAGVEQCGVGGVRRDEPSLLHLGENKF